MKNMLFIVLAFFSQMAKTDDMRPASLTITAQTSSSYNVVWKEPVKPDKRPAMRVVFDDSVKATSPKRFQKSNNSYIAYWSIKREQGLEGLNIHIDGLLGASGDVLLRIIEDENKTITAVLNTEHTRYVVPSIKKVMPEDTAVVYTVLGIEHILVGFDHLLFVACLVFISGTRKKLLMTITGFTLAHSITLMLSAKGLVNIPIQPVEAVIALSIIFLAWEIAKNNKNSLSLKYPVLVSSSFGLLHGFGFAAVLAEIGLPETEKLLALLCFNIGVEIGQLAFVAALFILFVLAAKLYTALTLEKLRFPVSYFCGSLATIWMLQRLATF
ncbi:MAG: HupE/UreJ family protein [Pseudomonadales bacterium]|nr:HupE/UreJ family protein [Pseudomonadales bacterium]